MTLVLSRLSLNLQHRDVRRDLGNPYDLHRTLTRAFVDGPDTSPRRCLWRLEAGQPGSPPVVLVQSDSQPCWPRLPESYLLQVEERSWVPEAVLQTGRAVRLRVLANPTVCRVPSTPEDDSQPHAPARGRRKRLGLWRESEQLTWMQRQGERLGLSHLQAAVSQSARWRCRKRGNVLTVAVAQFDAEGIIADAAALAHGIRQGIGHARMLGLGLVSVAPLRKP